MTDLLPCDGISFGSYLNTISLPRPKHMYPTSRGDWVTIDLCMMGEILELWKADVWTLECCCGHCKCDGYIAVDEGSRNKIEALGYIASTITPHVYVSKTNHNKPCNPEASVTPEEKKAALEAFDNLLHELNRRRNSRRTIQVGFEYETDGDFTLIRKLLGEK